MALSIAIRETATRLNRERQHRAEVRLDEIVKIAGIPEVYERAGRAGNLAVETAFARVYQLVDTEAEREAVVRAFTVWQSDERAENATVRGLSDDAVDLLKSSNPLFIDGAYVPGDSDGAA